MKSVKDLTAWSKENWEKIPALVREDCLNELAAKVPGDLLLLWIEQVRNGKEIGSNDTFFHHGVGMAVRNVMRAQLLDEELPPIKQEHIDGHPEARNWDDFYIGALHALVARAMSRGL